jgi:hypothetical protein
MNKHRTDLLLRWIEGNCTPDETRKIEHELKATPVVQDEVDQLVRLQSLMRQTMKASAPSAVRPFLADRVMRRLDSSRARLAHLSAEEELQRGLEWLFRRVAVACLIIIIGLAVYNVFQVTSYEANATTAEAVLGLPPVTIATADALDY